MPESKRLQPRRRRPVREDKGQARLYPSLAVVGQLDDKGMLDTADDGDPKRFILEQSDTGVVVLCVLMPSMDQVAARYGTAFAKGKGAKRGRATALFPIRGGDEVLVDKPSGAPVITTRLNSGNSELPKDWDNESILLALGDHALQAFNHAGSFLVWGKDGSLTFKQPDGATVQVSATGYVTVLDGDGNALWSNADGWQMVTKTGAAFKLGESIQLLAPENLDIGAKQATVAGNMIVGDATAGQLVLLDRLNAALVAAISAAIPQDGGTMALITLRGALATAGTTALKST